MILKRFGRLRGSIFCLPAYGLLLTTAPFTAGQAWAWGHTGHVSIGLVAADALPKEVKSFLRNDEAEIEISEWNAELDVSKTSGNIHDFERDPGHFLDISDDGSIAGVTSITSMPSSRRDFDTAMRGASPTNTQYGIGYLYYSLVDGWQQVRKDFAYIRAYSVGLKTAKSFADKSFFQTQLELRRKLTLRDIGVWGHYVADASQPMHVSVHFNGWGNFPNPNNFTNAPIHAPFEGSYVKQFVKPEAIKGALPPYRDCSCEIEVREAQYLQATLAEINETYQLAAVSNNYTTRNSQALKFVTQRLAAGAAELRDQIVDAWRSSATWVVGFPLINVADIESGKVKVNRDSFWSD
jgi:hypothetical protein